MAESSAQLHESPEALSPETVDRHRAVVSLMEELEAVDWYDQRIEATRDEELAAILTHNRDEEKEHAVLVLEWLRRRDPKLDGVLRELLFRPEAVAEELSAEDGGARVEAVTSQLLDGSLGIGSLRGELQP